MELKYSIENQQAKVTKVGLRTWVFDYPCDSYVECSPYKVSLVKGLYRFECYGAGNDRVGGGYTSGLIEIKDPIDVFLYLGAQTTDNPGAGLSIYNGGGGGSGQVKSGAGATDVRLVGGDWDDFESLKSRIMVAGGSGASECGLGGYGGGIIAGNGNSGYCGSDYYSQPGSGASNTEGGNGDLKGMFGKAGVYTSDANRNCGGGGYYGGGSNYDHGSGAGGGSSFVSGFNGCDAILEESTESNIKHSGQPVHYSGFEFFSIEMESGFENFIKPDRSGEENGHLTDGSAVVTYVRGLILCTSNIDKFLSLKNSMLFCFMAVSSN